MRRSRISKLGSRNSKVSVILVYHDAYGTLMETALKSLHAQVRQAEIVLVDGTGIPLALASNLGCREAGGEYLVRVDADDWIEPEMLEHEQEFLDQHKDVDCVWCDFIESREIAPNVFALDVVKQPVLEHACGAMMRRSVWEALKYDESLEYQEGYDFWCRFHQAGFKAQHLDVPLYYYRRHPGSMSTNPAREQVRRKLEQKYAGQIGDNLH